MRYSTEKQWKIQLKNTLGKKNNLVIIKIFFVFITRKLKKNDQKNILK